MFGKIGHKIDDAVHALIHHPDPGVIFITGNGCLGQRVATRLLKAGYPKVRVGVRDVDSAAEISKEGAELVDFCWEREDTYAKALDEVKTVFCATPHHDGWADRFPAFFKQCKASGVKHFVKVSFYHALTATRAHVMKNFHVSVPEENPFSKVPLIKMHGDCDEMVLKSHFNYTILFASHLMSNPLVYQGSNLRDEDPGKFYGATGGKGVNYVSPNDVAEVAVCAMLSPNDHRRVGYNLTGPVAIKDEDVAALLGKYLSKPVTYVDQSIQEFEEREKTEGDPSWLVADLVGLEKVKASGLEDSVGFVSKDIEKVCGHPAETFEDYLAATTLMTRRELGSNASKE